MDDGARLLTTAATSAPGSAGLDVFRCVDGVPVPRPGPWSNAGCDTTVWSGATLLVAGDEGTIVPGPGACLVVAPSDGMPTTGRPVVRARS